MTTTLVMVGRGGSIIEVKIGQIGDLLFPVDSSRVGRMICSFGESRSESVEDGVRCAAPRHVASRVGVSCRLDVGVDTENDLLWE